MKHEPENLTLAHDEPPASGTDKGVGSGPWLASDFSTMKALKRFLSRWRILPSVSYTNFKKEYPQSQCWNQWFSISRYWSGKIINVMVKHHQLSFDFRRDFIADLKNPLR